ncbi:MAG TPA: aminoglycoside adenylyltransferase domain-containing protein [Dehalococcoidia bacterium]|nr:aminoglycoside adenylyltransferase domain-containing protein [Dehalococcoidia bacterium]
MITTLDEVAEPARGAVRLLRASLLRGLGDDVAAIWLYGATIFGPRAIDVDLHVLLRQPPGASGSKAIQAAHDTVERENPGIDLDTWYILLDDARKPEPPPNVGPWHPGVRDEHWALHRAHWLAGAVIVVHGLAPQGIVPPPEWQEIEQALRRDAEEAGRVLSGGSPYWTLQLCRILASLETRDVVRSKLDSGAWALERLGPGFAPIIRAAQRYYSGVARPGDLDLIKSGYPAFYEALKRLIDAA